MNEDWYFNAFEELVYISDIDTYELLYMNNTCRELAGFKESEYSGLKCHKALQNLDTPCPFCNNHLLSEDSIYKWEYSNPVFNRHFSLKDKLINWHGHRARLEIAVDITNYKEQVLATEHKMSSVMQSIPGGVCEVMDDDSLTVLWHNDHFLGLIGYTAEQFEREMGGKANYVHPDDLMHVLQVMNEVRSTGNQQMMEMRIIRRDGQELSLLTTISYNKGRGGQPSSFYSVGMDITEYKQIIERGTNALKTALKDAQQASIAKGRFLSRMSHEIRTPLNAVIGMAAIAGMSLDDKKTLTNCHQKINTSARYLLSLINDILDVSRIESGKMELGRQEFSFYDFLNDIESMFRLAAEHKQIDFIVQSEPFSDGWFRGDALRCKQVVVNLLSNAFKFTPEHGCITLTVRRIKRTGNTVFMEISVKDTGIGIAPAALERIFDTFEQQDNNITVHFGGSGLGLSICRMIVELMGGTINVESQPGMGSRFVATLPLECCEKPKTQYIGQGQIPQNFQGKRALVAEDNAINQEIIATLLQARGFVVETANNGREALDKFTKLPEGSFDVVLMDISMPVMNGLEATCAIRNLARNDANLPIVALSANAFAEDKRVSLESGMNDHVAKPVDMEELCHVLARLL